ncbi:hypothetical protein R1flu_022845 [Riccia fluitans]|uniref:Uncharacterized protein n=1 Tax=Riccia fluitans TaxID=41844 RepID=A0ABD1XQC4_9MARC
MWNCLPLSVLGRSDDEVYSKAESQITWRSEGSLTTPRLRSMSKSKITDSSLVVEVAPGGGGGGGGGVVIIDPTLTIHSKTSSRETVAAAYASESDALLASSAALRWPSAQRRLISSWFSHVVDYVGKVLLAYLAGVAEKMEKLEYNY